MDRRSTFLVVTALMTAAFITALDVTVVGTAMPSIVGQLGGLTLYSWVFSAYLMTSTITVPIYGKLADLYGRLPVFFFGVTLFMVGSALCGLSQSMEQLIAFRAVQGLGGGAVQPLVITMIGDAFSIEQRAKLQGVFSGVWGAGSILGPLVGGTFTHLLSWRLVFYVNIPIGIAACVLLARYFPERVERRRHYIDVPGALLLALGLTGLLLAIAPDRSGGSNDPATMALLLVPSVLLLAAFVKVETMAPEPLLPLHLFRIGAISVGAVVTILMGAVLFGVTSFVPLWVQGVLGGTPTQAGLMLIPMSAGWSTGSIASGKIVTKYGFRPCLQTGVVCLAVGSALIAVAQPLGLVPGVGIGAFVVGLGLGFCTLAVTVVAQNSVGWEFRGVATSTVLFSRTIGGSIGVTILGTVLASGMAERMRGLAVTLPGVAPGAPLNVANALLEPTVRQQLDPQTLLLLGNALNQSLSMVFIGVVLFSVAALLATLRFPAVTASGLEAQRGARQEASDGAGR